MANYFHWQDFFSQTVDRDGVTPRCKGQTRIISTGGTGGVERLRTKRPMTLTTQSKSGKEFNEATNDCPACEARAACSAKTNSLTLIGVLLVCVLVGLTLYMFIRTREP